MILFSHHRDLAKFRAKALRNWGLFSPSRSVISIGLTLLLIASPLSFIVSAQEPTFEKTPPGDYFVLYRDQQGEIACRQATLIESRELEEIRPEGLRRISHVAPETFSKDQSAQTSENDLPAHLTIILEGTDQLEQNQPAKAAFIRAAQAWEAQIKSPITIYLQVDFGPTNFGTNWSPDTLGSTNSPTVPGGAYYQDVRTNLIAGASNATEQAAYQLLPTISVPTDLGAATSMSVSSSIGRAIGLLNPTAQATDPKARIGINSSKTYDFDPSDGISGGTDFEAVATHEIGHALGFTSRAGQGSSIPGMWDLFRFRTGTTSASFATAQRILTIGGPIENPLQYYFFPEETELGLSTGGPSAITTNNGDGHQSSHWKNPNLNGGVVIGIMVPTIGSNTRRQISLNDTKALNAFGYNLDNSNPPPPPPPPPPVPANNDFANPQVITGCSGSVNGTNIGANKETGEPSHSPDENPGGASVWYNWQAPSSGSVNITTAGSNYDTLLGVYTGSSVNTLTRITRNDDVELGVITTSTVTFDAVAGTVYRIAVDGYGGETGSIVLNWNASNCVSSSPTIQLSQGAYSYGEGNTSASVTITRSGDLAGAATVDYLTSDSSGQTKCDPQPATGLASERCDYQTTVGTVTIPSGQASAVISIPLVNDVHLEGNETFSFSIRNAVGTTLGALTTATVTITDNDTVFTQANPIDTFETYVRQQYLDFLSREPDSGGFSYWMGRLQTCAATQGCDMVKERKMVSAGFFYSNEFLLRKGYFVYRFYAASLGRRPTYAEFIPDLASMGQNDAEEEAKRVEFTNRWVTRADFIARYPNSLSNTEFVNKLVDTAGITLDRNQLITQLNGGTTRAQIVRQVAESQPAFDKFFKEAFISMQYFGYLRRDPDAGGYDYWFGRLPPTRQEIDANPDLYIYDMVGGFVYSTEYQLRFGNRNY